MDIVDKLRSHTEPPHDDRGNPMYRICYDAADEIERLRETLQGIAEADWRKWDELASPDEFVRWAKARANHALAVPNAIELTGYPIAGRPC